MNRSKFVGGYFRATLRHRTLSIYIRTCKNQTYLVEYTDFKTQLARSYLELIMQQFKLEHKTLFDFKCIHLLFQFQFQFKNLTLDLFKILATEVKRYHQKV